MNKPASNAGCASRQNDWRGVKTNLFFKFYGGPNIGLLHSSREHLTGDLDHAIGQILRALGKIGVEIPRGALVLKLRRFDEKSPFVDGVFSGPNALGYLLYAPCDMTSAEVERFMFDYVNPVPFYLAHRDGDPEHVFMGHVLPGFPGLPPPLTVVWSAENGSVPVIHGH